MPPILDEVNLAGDRLVKALLILAAAVVVIFFVVAKSK